MCTEIGEDIMDELINYEAVTFEECEENYRYNHKAVILNDGKIMGFEEYE